MLSNQLRLSSAEIKLHKEQGSKISMGKQNFIGIGSQITVLVLKDNRQHLQLQLAISDGEPVKGHGGSEVHDITSMFPSVA